MLGVGLLGGQPGAGELLVVFLAFLLLFGAEKLPTIARQIGRALEEFRRSAQRMRDELMRAAGDAEPPPDDAPPPGQPPQGSPPQWPEPKPPPYDDASSTRE